jgi:hypothetical protein
MTITNLKILWFLGPKNGPADAGNLGYQEMLKLTNSTSESDITDMWLVGISALWSQIWIARPTHPNEEGSYWTELSSMGVKPSSICHDHHHDHRLLTVATSWQPLILFIFSDVPVVRKLGAASFHLHAKGVNFSGKIFSAEVYVGCGAELQERKGPVSSLGGFLCFFSSGHCSGAGARLSAPKSTRKYIKRNFYPRVFASDWDAVICFFHPFGRIVGGFRVNPNCLYLDIKTK